MSVGLAAICLIVGYTARVAECGRHLNGLLTAQILLAVILLGLALPTSRIAFLADGAASVG